MKGHKCRCSSKTTTITICFQRFTKPAKEIPITARPSRKFVALFVHFVPSLSQSLLYSLLLSTMLRTSCDSQYYQNISMQSKLFGYSSFKCIHNKKCTCHNWEGSISLVQLSIRDTTCWPISTVRVVRCFLADFLPSYMFPVFSLNSTSPLALNAFPLPRGSQALRGHLSSAHNRRTPSRYFSTLFSPFHS